MDGRVRRTSYRDPRVVLVACALVVSAVGIAFAVDAPAVSAESKSQAYFEQFLEGEGGLPHIITSHIAMTDFDPSDEAHPSALAFGTQITTCDIRQRRSSPEDEARFPLHVFDLIGDGSIERPEYWSDPGGCFTPNSLDLTPDGRTLVAQVKAGGSIGASTCPDANYDDTQIVTWTRSGVGAAFAAPQLVSKSGIQPSGCDDAVDLGEHTPANLIGQGGDQGSSYPSVSDDGAIVAFTSSADDFSVAPTSSSTQALYLAGPDGAGLAMVTPAGFVGTASAAQISGDGKAVVFVASGHGLVSGVGDSDGNQVFVARRASTTSSTWSIDLVSELDADPLDGPSASPQISRDGTRVVFTTAASHIEEGVDTDDEVTGYWLVAREIADLPTHPLRVVVDPRNVSVGYPTSDSLDAPAMSGDGGRVAIVAGHDGATRFRLFDVTMALRDDIDDELLTEEQAEGSRADATIDGARRILLGSANRPIGIGGRGQRNLVALGGFGPPFDRYVGSGPALYLGGGGQIGPDISKGLHGDPVDTANGAFLQEETDLVADRAPAFMGVHRSYSSVGEQSGVFGPGWASAIDTRLDVNDELGAVVLGLPSGRNVIYRESGGVWSTTMGYRSSLAAKTGGGWEVTDRNGDVWTFDEDGLLVAWSSAGGSVEVGARTSGGVPATITADNGDVLTLTDNKQVNSSGETVSGTDGRIDRIATSHGVVVDYGYTRNGAGTVLKMVSGAHLSTQSASTYGWRTYVTAGARIVKISSGMNRTIVENTYDAKGRVVHQVNDTGDELTFDYAKKPEPPAGLIDAPGFTTVTNAASGDVTVYEYSPDGEVLGITDALGNSVARSWENEQPGSSTSRSGVETSYSYDGAGRVLTVSETVGASTVVTSALAYVTPDTDPDAKADQRVATSTDAAGVTTTLTYTGDLVVPATSSVPCDESSLGSGIDCPTSGLATTVFDYDTSGPVPLLTEQTDPDGVRTTRTYHPDGTLASSTVYDDGDVARTTMFERLYADEEDFPFGSPAAWADRTEKPDGAVSWEVYDAAGRVVETSTEMGEEEAGVWTVTRYDFDGSIAHTADPVNGNTDYWERHSTDPGWDEEAEGASISEVRYSVDEDGVVTTTKIDRSGDTVSTAIGNDDLGEQATTTNTYGELGRLLTSTGPTGVVTSYHYDTEGRVTGVTTGPDPDDPAHTVATEYDPRGRVLSETTPMGNDPDGNPVQRKVSFTYDSAGRKASQLDGAGGPSGEQLLTGFEYDDAGRLWRTVEHRHSYVDTAHPTTLHDADKVTETRYTLAGRTAEEVGPPVDVSTFAWSGSDATKAIMAYGYDEAGRQTSVTAPDSGTTTTTYDENSQVASITTPGGYETLYAYDTAGRKVSTATPSGLTGPGDPATVVQTTTYDGQEVCETDPHIPESGVADPSTRCTVRTNGGRVGSVTDANGNEVTYGYDSRGNRTSRTALNDASAEVVESWGYNLADQELTHTVPPPRSTATAKTTTSTYDPDFGWLATVTDPTARVRTHTYYTDGTLKTRTFTRSTDTPVVDKYWVNGRGWRIKSTVTNTSTKTQSATYDRVGQKLTEVSQLNETLSHSYGLAGEQRTLGYADGATGVYLHDPVGRLSEVSVTSGGITVPYASYGYDADGRETSELIHAAGGATRTSTYDAAGRQASFTEILPNHTSTWETYQADLTYRPDGRLATETVNSDPTITYDYDDAGQLTSSVDGVRDRAWTYGTRGNRLTATDNGAVTTYLTNPNGSVAKTTQGTNTVTYAYDDAGRRIVANKKNGPTPTGSTTNGVTTEGYTSTIQVSGPGLTTTTEYRRYDADGKLATSDTLSAGTAVTRTYHWDTTQAVPQIIEAKNQGALWFKATWGTQRIAFKSGTAAPQWFQYDTRGSVIRTDPTNTDVVNGPKQYTPFGAMDTPTGPDRIGYRGELTSSDLVNLRNRNYDPTSGQFTSQDPLDGVDGTPVVANTFHYTDNDPLDRSDPLGLRGHDDDLLPVIPPANGADGALCSPPVGKVGGISRVIVYNSAEQTCGFWKTGVKCARGDGIPGANWICQHRVGTLQALSAVLVASLVVASGGAAAELGAACGWSWVCIATAAQGVDVIGSAGAAGSGGVATTLAVTDESGAIMELSTTEAATVAEADAVMASSEFAAIRSAQDAGRAASVDIGGVTVEYEPGGLGGAQGYGLASSGTHGFVLSPEAFVSDEELSKTLLHELYRLNTGQNASGQPQAYVTDTTAAADAFANRTWHLLNGGG